LGNAYHYSDETYSLSISTLLNASTFSEGRAWVQYHDGEDVNTAAIDTDGNIIILICDPVLYASDFKDGIAFFVTCPNAVLYKRGDSSFGNNVFSWNSSNDSIYFHTVDESGSITDVDYRLLAHGDGQFIAATHISNFDVDEWRIGTIDKYGNEINEFRNYTWEFWGSNYTFRFWDFDFGDFTEVKEKFRYVGDGVFLLHGDLWERLFIYNTRTQSFTMHDGRGFTYKSDYYNGLAMITDRGGNYSSINTSGSLVSKNVRPQMRYGSVDSNIFGFNEAIKGSSPRFTYSDGLMYYDHSYIDIKGTRVIDIKQYNDKAMFCGPFSDGYAAMLVVGADKNPYATIIDRNGMEQYPPRRVEKINFFINEGYFLVYIDSTIQILSMKGEVVRIIEVTNQETFSTNWDGTVHDGWLRLHVKTVSSGISKYVLYNVKSNQTIGQYGWNEMTVTFWGEYGDDEDESSINEEIALLNSEFFIYDDFQLTMPGGENVTFNTTEEEIIYFFSQGNMITISDVEDFVDFIIGEQARFSFFRDDLCFMWTEEIGAQFSKGITIGRSSRSDIISAFGGNYVDEYDGDDEDEEDSYISYDVIIRDSYFWVLFTFKDEDQLSSIYVNKIMDGVYAYDDYYD